MPQAFQLHCHGFPTSEAFDAAAQQHAAKLDGFFDHVQLCRVFVTSPPHHHRHGRDFAVRIELMLPGDELHVNPSPSFPGQFEDGYVALTAAFALAREQLIKWVHRHARGELKHHSQPGS